MIEIVFEFNKVREFHQLHIFSNNQFTRDVAVFKVARVFFSIGGDIYNEDFVEHVTMEDPIIEEPRNVTVQLHRRVAKFVKVQLNFAAKWIMISEVNFASSVARGNYSAEVAKYPVVKKPTEISIDLNEKKDRKISASSAKPDAPSPATNDDDTEATFMPVVIGILTAVILLLAAIILFIVNRNRQRKWLSVQMNEDGSEILGAEKVTLANNSLEGDASNTYPFNYAHRGFAVHSDSSSANSSTQRHQAHLIPKLDDNYNTPHRSVHATPLAVRVHSNSVTPRSGRKTLPPPPRLQVPPPPPTALLSEEAVYTEPGTYVEPYRALRYSPYYSYGPMFSEVEESLMKQSLLSGNSCLTFANLPSILLFVVYF